ncbi:hypothetical protein AKJ52_01950 [candidate division MSBL1 archaeon SCGC-AAA382C18]|uniref:Uncharacterized protein n=1 Tax=candidate division MSBL1 archaeon SCGC-AAA382C18 TaxID=1698281 RepID=A0A133VJI7_9EURY|nr:hypothetical protein AKJ52_01950 [candidate division MSBL1 archaeon SCGC-AAA382C18]
MLKMEKITNLELEERGFFSLDGLFAMILLLLIVGNFVNIYQGRSEMVEDTRKRLEGKMINEKLAGAINTVYATGKPLTLNIDLEENILGEEYTIDFNNNSRDTLIKISGKTKSLATSDVIPENIQLKNLDSPKKVRIFWENSKIKVK